MRCKYCGRRLKTLFYYTTKPKYKKNNTKFAYCENCDRVFRITVAEVTENNGKHHQKIKRNERTS